MTAGSDPWNAASYDRVSGPQVSWGRKVLDRLELEGTELVLDAGCGTGRVTEELLARLPHGRVVGLDRSPAMATLARRRLPPARSGVVVADLRQPLPFRPRTFDAVFSTATFHWVPGHRDLFARLSGVLRPGGQLVAQCGGEGNIASVARVLAEIDADGGADAGPPLDEGGARRGTWAFPHPDDTERRLRAAGFVDFWCWLNQEETTFPSLGALAEFLRTVVLWPQLERLPARERDGFVDLVVDRLPGPVLDYVRLNILARMPANGRRALS
jgi:trans-aconitate 2-methyltransferase